jgi:hypothetical protein
VWHPDRQSAVIGVPMYPSLSGFTFSVGAPGSVIEAGGAQNYLYNHYRDMSIDCSNQN